MVSAAGTRIQEPQHDEATAQMLLDIHKRRIVRRDRLDEPSSLANSSLWRSSCLIARKSSNSHLVSFARSTAAAQIFVKIDRPLPPTPQRVAIDFGSDSLRVSASFGTVRYFAGFLSMRKPGSNKRSKARVGRPTTKTLATPNDPVKRGPRQRSPQADSSLVGAFFNSQVAVAQLMYQFSPLQMITRQQAIMLDTFASALNGALEAHDNEPQRSKRVGIAPRCVERLAFKERSKNPVTGSENHRCIRRGG